MSNVQPYRFVLRRGTTAAWSDADPILRHGEPGVEFLVDGTTRIKFGNGVDLWSALPYVEGDSQDAVAGSDMVSGVAVWWYDAGADAAAPRPPDAAATDVVIWTNTPTQPANMGGRDQWEDLS